MNEVAVHRRCIRSPSYPESALRGYNRTLTPFGFQAEPRTYWQAPEIYQAMAPFTHVPKLNEPILLIHGMRDANPGTFPVQSERMFAAIKGVKARYVQLLVE
jgi:dipeptidyl aminopeptidase/acylaminoacyl peptidase